MPHQPKPRLHGRDHTAADPAATLYAKVGTPGSGGIRIQDEGVDLTVRKILNFVGAGVTATDDSAHARTDVTIPGGGGVDLSAYLHYGNNPGPLVPADVAAGGVAIDVSSVGMLIGGSGATALKITSGGGGPGSGYAVEIFPTSGDSLNVNNQIVVKTGGATGGGGPTVTIRDASMGGTAFSATVTDSISMSAPNGMQLDGDVYIIGSLFVNGVAVNVP